MNLWMRYLTRQLMQTFFFFLVSFFFIYVLVDLSINGVGFLFQGTARAIHLVLYYLRHLSMHLELFFALSFLLATLKVLLDLSQHHELVALQMAGLSRKRLLTPFYLLATTLCIFCYANSEWFAPNAQDAIQSFQSDHHNKKKQKQERLCTICLDDRTDLVYQAFENGSLQDVFWIRSPKEIWHMKRLDVSVPRYGHQVDHFIRNQNNQFEKIESWEKKPFADLLFPADCQLEKWIPFENRPLTLLGQQAFLRSTESFKASAHLHYKLARPLLPLLALFAIAPFSMRSTRQQPLFLLVAVSLFGFIAFMTLMEGLLILSENRVLPAAVSAWGPLIGLLATCLRPFSKI